LRGLGGNAAPDRASGLRTQRWRERLHEALAARSDDQGRIRLSFEVVYGHAFKAPPRPGRGEASVVSLESLRAKLRRDGA
jgi:malonyl-CoA O-methyltransferase